MRLYRPGVIALALGLVAGVAAVVTITRPAAAEQTQKVSYRGYQVTVPASWPVIDLAKNPTTCVRLDQPAVYLGRSTAQADCPARAVGRSEGIVLEPLTKATPSAPGLMRRTVKDAGVLATAYYAPGDEQEATDLLATGRVTSKTASAQVVEPAAVTPSIVATGKFTGGAFDACTAPPQSTMDAWLPDYQAVGIYISGGLRACAQPNLTADWVSTNAGKGWQFLLIDVGLQAPCSNLSSKMSTVPATAYAQGKTAAGNAVTAAQALGFAQRSAIYSDIEAYASTAACKAAVLSYLTGWTQELNARGYLGGAYVGAASGGIDLNSAYGSTSYTHPDNLWFARWNNVADVTDDKYISSTNWTNHQRVHQYAGNVNETHGGVSLNIDKNWVDLTPPPPPVTGLGVTGGVNRATLKWTNPAGTTLGQIIVRGASGNAAPSLPKYGTAVYAGTGTTYTQTGLANSSSYAYQAWVKDSTGKIGPGVTTRLIGTKSTMTASTSSLVYGGSVTLSATFTRIDSGAKLTGVPVYLYKRAKNVSTWSYVGPLTTNTSGAVSSVQKPTVSTYYTWGYNGSTGLLGTRSPSYLVQVKPTISAYLSPATIKLGATSTFYGYLNPPHAGTSIYLQRWTGTAWGGVATGKVASNGKYTFTVKPPAARGKYSYRVVWSADADHQGTQTPTKVLTVS